MDTKEDENTPLIETISEPELEELTGCGACAPCNPRKAIHRYIILSIMCFLSFGK